MKRRLIVSIAGLGLVCLILSADASEKVDFRLSNQSEAPVSELPFNPVPVGTIAPPVVAADPQGQPVEGSPLTALDSSKGVDPENVYLLLGTQPPVDDGPEQEQLVLLFGYTPNPEADEPTDPPFLPALDAEGNRVGMLEPGGNFDFELSLQDAAASELLNLPPSTPGLELGLLRSSDVADIDVNDSNPLPGAGSGAGGDSEVVLIPEPSTVLMWGTLAVFGVLGARYRRRSHSASA